MITFSSAEQRDLPLLFALNRQLIDDYEDIAAIDYDRVLAWVEKNLKAHLGDFRRILYDGQLCGFFCLAEGELDSLFLFPEFQGRGIGTAVLRHCQAVSPALRLFVFKENIRALSLYQKLGFEVTAEAGTTRYIMEWKNQDR